MISILLSVNPRYTEQILSGIKLFEYRKRLAQKSVDRIILYATYPLMKVIGEVEVIKIVSGSPTSVWEQTKKNAGISREKYRKYFKGCKVAFAYQLGKVTAYKYPKALIDFGIDHPPQSFIYVGE